MALLLFAHATIDRARFPRGRPSWLRARALVEWKMLRRTKAEPIAYEPHISWSEGSSGVLYGWTFFAALLVGKLVLIFNAPFETVRTAYTLSVSGCPVGGSLRRPA